MRGSDGSEFPPHRLRLSCMSDLSIMYLVIRKDHAASLEELLVASARAVFRVMDRWQFDAKHKAAFADWRANLYGKVMLRASEKQWTELASFDGANDASDAPLVRALPPRLKSSRERLLMQLQVYTAVPESLPSRMVPTGDAPVLPIVVNSKINMSAGKLAAQIGHAAMFAHETFTDEAWIAAGRPCVVLKSNGHWDALKAMRALVVTDAGLTEIDGGSETVLALAPAKWERQSALVRSLKRI